MSSSSSFSDLIDANSASILLGALAVTAADPIVPGNTSASAGRAAAALLSSVGHHPGQQHQHQQPLSVEAQNVLVQGLELDTVAAAAVAHGCAGMNLATCTTPSAFGKGTLQCHRRRGRAAAAENENNNNNNNNEEGGGDGKKKKIHVPRICLDPTAMDAARQRGRRLVAGMGQTPAQVSGQISHLQVILKNANETNSMSMSFGALSGAGLSGASLGNVQQQGQQEQQQQQQQQQGNVPPPVVPHHQQQQQYQQQQPMDAATAPPPPPPPQFGGGNLPPRLNNNNNISGAGGGAPVVRAFPPPRQNQAHRLQLPQQQQRTNYGNISNNNNVGSGFNMPQVKTESGLEEQQQQQQQPPPPSTIQEIGAAVAKQAGGAFVSAKAQLESDAANGRPAAVNAMRGGVLRRAGAGLSKGTGFKVPFQTNQEQQPQLNQGGLPQQQQQNHGGGGLPGVNVNNVLGSVVNPHRGGAPVQPNNNKQQPQQPAKKNKAPPPPNGGGGGGDSDDEDENGGFPASLLNADGTIPEHLQTLEPKLVARIASEILETRLDVGWEDIAGLEHAKSAVEEAIVWPMLSPEIFSGIRSPPKGLLLFGPPGTGKTMIARAIASRGNCTFFAVSSSVLMSKWIGEGEKLVRCLFAVAQVKQPSVVFIDEIDSLLTARGEGEGEAVRRVKTEFLVHLDGVATSGNDRVLVVGATNRPDELDEAARRRLEKRLYIPLPEQVARKQMLHICLKDLEKEASGVRMSEDEFDSVAARTDGFSGADLKNLAREASMAPLREAMLEKRRQNGGVAPKLSKEDLRPVEMRDFEGAMSKIKPSVGQNELGRYVQWNQNFGSFQFEKTA